MKVVDANVLLYAINDDTTRHRSARDWLTEALNNQEPVGFTWIVILAFLRLSTSHVVFPRPLSINTATEVIEDWLAQPSAVVLEPRAGHLTRVRDLLTATGSGGNLINDAHIAAVALDRKSTVMSYDVDFTRFPGVRWEQPPS